jgi:hypothetical protein
VARSDQGLATLDPRWAQREACEAPRSMGEICRTIRRVARGQPLTVDLEESGRDPELTHSRRRCRITSPSCPGPHRTARATVLRHNASPLHGGRGPGRVLCTGGGQASNPATIRWTKGLVRPSDRPYGHPGANGGAARYVTGGDTGESTRFGTRPTARPVAGNVPGAGVSAGPSAGLSTGPSTGTHAGVPPSALFRCQSVRWRRAQ